MRNFDSLPDYAQVSVKEIAQLVGISKATVWRRVADKTLAEPIRHSARCTRWIFGDVRKAFGIPGTAG